MTYIIGLTISMCLSLFIDKFKNKYIRFLYILFSLSPLIIISALRFGVGTDYFFRYYPDYLKILAGEDPAYKEYGFVYLNKLLALLSDDPTWMFALTSLIFGFNIALFMSRNSSNATLSIFVFVFCGLYFFSMNNIRQALALSFFLLSYNYLKDLKIFRFIILIVIASLFHISALFLLPIFIFSFKVVQKHFKLAYLLTLIFTPIILYLFLLIIPYTPFNEYLSNVAFKIGDGFKYQTTLNLSLFILLYINLNKYVLDDRKAYILLSMQFTALVISILGNFINSPQMFVRIIYYFNAFLMLSIPYSLSLNKTNKYNITYFFIYMFILVSHLSHYYYFKGAEGCLPYKSIFSKEAIELLRGLK